ncbi:MAG: hypothetical protein HDR33_05060 [Treponema sp.]|nr:hypothetical protein [Treponema sp.]
MNYKLCHKDIENISLNSELYDSLLNICKKYAKKITDSFFSDISKVLHEYTGIYLGQKEESKNIQFSRVEECVFLANVFFEEASNEKSIEKLLITLHILFFFEQDYRLLNTSLICEDFKSIIIKVTKCIDLKINVPEDAPYNEKKMLEIFATAKEKKDFNEVIGVMDTLIYHSDIFPRLKKTWGELINFVAFLDRNIVFSILEEAECEKIDAFLFTMHKKFFMNLNWSISNKYLLLRMFKLWIECINETYFKVTNDETVPDCSAVLKDLLLNPFLCLEDYLEVLRVQYSESFNYLIGQLLVKDNSFLPIYLNHLVFGIKETVAFSKGFLLSVDDNLDNEVICSTIESIKNKFFEHEVHDYSEINLYTGYLDLFGYYFSKRFNTREVFLKKLFDYSNKIQKLQSSWNQDDITKIWVEFYYFCLSNVNGKYIFSEQEIRQNCPILFDKRNKLFYDATSIDNMKKLLMKPSEPLDLEFKIMPNDCVKISINKGNRV